MEFKFFALHSYPPSSQCLSFEMLIFIAMPSECLFMSLSLNDNFNIGWFKATTISEIESEIVW